MGLRRIPEVGLLGLPFVSWMTLLEEGASCQ